MFTHHRALAMIVSHSRKRKNCDCCNHCKCSHSFSSSTTHGRKAELEYARQRLEANRIVFDLHVDLAHAFGHISDQKRDELKKKSQL